MPLLPHSGRATTGRGRCAEVAEVNVGWQDMMVLEKPGKALEGSQGGVGVVALPFLLRVRCQESPGQHSGTACAVRASL